MITSADFAILNAWQPFEIKLMEKHLAEAHPDAAAPLLTFDTTACDECWRIAEQASNLASFLGPGEEIKPEDVKQVLTLAVYRDEDKRLAFEKAADEDLQRLTPYW